MAKQRGIHQISGKINNLCYYQQKYVPGGLIRRINEAMSERLKIDPVFENTRHANKVFGGCSICASILLSFFGSRSTFLFKPYRHALLTRAVQRYLIEDYDDLGYPILLNRSLCFLVLPQIIDSIVKKSIFDSFPDLERQIGNLSVDSDYVFNFSYDSLVNFCKKNKCVGIQISVTRAHYIYSIGFNAELDTYTVPENNAGGRVSYQNWLLNQDTEGVEITANTGTIDDAATFWIVYALPIKRMQQNRPITSQTGASCGLISFLAT